jgi:hypothetical protein
VLLLTGRFKRTIDNTVNTKTQLQKETAPIHKNKNTKQKKFYYYHNQGADFLEKQFFPQLVKKFSTFNRDPYLINNKFTRKRHQTFSKSDEHN